MFAQYQIIVRSPAQWWQDANYKTVDVGLDVAMVVKRVLSMSLIMITVLTLDFTFDMTYAMAVGAQNKTLANFGQDSLCRSAPSDG
jgi:hypothetical protein